MKTLTRTVVALTAVVVLGGLGPLSESAVAVDPGPTPVGATHQGWWCRLTHLC